MIASHISSLNNKQIMMTQGEWIKTLECLMLYKIVLQALAQAIITKTVRP